MCGTIFTTALFCITPKTLTIRILYFSLRDGSHISVRLFLYFSPAPLHTCTAPVKRRKSYHFFFLPGACGSCSQSSLFCRCSGHLIQLITFLICRLFG